MSAVEPPRAPRGTRAPGRRLWRSVVDVFDLDEHELVLLVEAVRTVDLLDVLEARIRADGPVVSSPQGMRAHPAVVEARQQRITLARLFAALRLKVGEDHSEVEPTRTQGRGAPRGVYGLRSTS